MKKVFLLLFIGIVLSCSSARIKEAPVVTSSEKAIAIKTHFTLVFASCNDQNREQPLWEPILKHQPDVFVWGGDNIYADTADMQKMKADYNKVWAQPLYRQLAKETTIIGTWDDHDYGKNDAGVEWHKKEEAQQLFLDFLKIPATDSLRNQKGIYYSQSYQKPEGSVKIVLLDTRYFRDSLQNSTVEDRRYEAWGATNKGSVLGEAQWKWLEEQLQEDRHDFTVIISSIQFLANQHGWEKWGNHPQEVEKMKQLLAKAAAKNIFFLSGDRHLAEFSVTQIKRLPYPLIDFTSSGLTHTYPEFLTEANPYRVGEVIKELNFAVLHFDFENKKVVMEVRGKGDRLYQSLVQQY